MRTNIVLDLELLKVAFRFSKAKTKRELIHQALQEYVANHGRADLSEIRGKVRFRKGYFRKTLRGTKAA
jgi:Arc/MetJ family transcription regulator